MSENEKEKLERQIGPLVRKLNKLKEKEKCEDNENLVGRCGRYRNSYGSDRPSWWLYRKVMSLTSDNGLNVFSFQEDCLGELKIKPKDCAMGESCTLGDKISEKQFQAAWALMKKKIEAIEP